MFPTRLFSTLHVVLSLIVYTTPREANETYIRELQQKVHNSGACQKEILSGKVENITVATVNKTSHLSECVVQSLTKFMTEEEINWFNGLANIKRATPVVRKDIRLYSKHERDRIFQALKEMKNTQPENSNTSQYDIFVAVHIPQIGPAGTRTGASQWGWHREYLLRFETALLKHLEDFKSVGIPYWDVTLDSYLPDPKDSILWTDDFFGRSFLGPNDDPMVMNICRVKTGHFADWTLSGSCKDMVRKSMEAMLSLPPWAKAMNKTAPLSDSEIESREDYFGNELTRSCLSVGDPTYNDKELEIIMGMKTFDEFSSSHCITRDHDKVHGFIGGATLLGDASCVVEDPAVWFLHTYLDYLWEQWRSVNHLEWPDDTNQGICHRAGDIMSPFNEKTNIDGLSPTYARDMYMYETAKTSCQEQFDCGSEFLWCDTVTSRCKTKIRKGGDCGGYPSEICYDGTCDDSNVCS